VNRNAERGRATRDQILDVAVRLFGSDGYENTSIEAVLRSAGVSRGSLYHHFPSKEALFSAVVERLQQDVTDRLAATAEDATGPADLLRRGGLAWVELSADPVIQRVMLIDAPAVLGWERWRELDEVHVLGDVRQALAWAAEEGAFDPKLVDTFAHIVLAAVNEISLMIARADDQEEAMVMARAAVDEFLSRLLGVGSH
jgi:AcrR family transcriptional regulator